MFDLSRKVALVTGAGRGIGVGIARQLAAAGAAVVVNDLFAERASQTADELAKAGATARPASFDVTDLAAVQEAVARIEAEVGPVGILVNNAGVPVARHTAQFLDTTQEDWARYVDLNLFGVLNCVKAVLPGMQERRWGRIITISSGAGTSGVGLGVSLYGAGKGGAISFMRHLAVESASYGVTANTLALGIVAHPDRGQERNSLTAKMESQIPVGRAGTGDDVGYACVYLASGEASWMTGQTIGLNGGMLTS